MKRVTHAIKALFLISFLISSGSGQEQNAVKADLNEPGEQHQKLDVLAGKWDVVVKIPVAPGREMQGQASCVATWVFDGRYIRQEYSSTFAGKPLTIVRYLGFDRHKNSFVEIQFESTHTDVMFNLGSISSDGKTIMSSGTFTDRGVKVDVRSVTKIVDNDNFELQLTYTDATGSRSEYPKTLTLLHKRKPQ